MKHILIDHLEHWLAQYRLEVPSSVAMAVSGGPDSMALSHLIAEWAQSQDAQVHFITVDHGLRPEAAHEAKMVSDWVTAQNNKNLHHQTLLWVDEKPDAAIMEAARAARYELMASYCEAHALAWLFVAHHQDDQAETFLIRLAKGSGLDGLGGMQNIRPYNDHLKIARPLLDIPKAELVDYCDVNHIPYVKDPSNEDAYYLRPRLRQSMAVLAEEGLTSKRLALTTKRLSRAREALQEIAANAYQAALLEKKDEAFIFNFSMLQACPEEIAFRVLQQAVEQFRIDNDYAVRMERLEDLFESLWYSSESFKPRTLGGCLFSIEKGTLLKLKIEKEKR